jgi:4-hydroxybenzoate polyprenyltransferase
MAMAVRQVGEFAADIKLSHSVFALPFALLAGCLAGLKIGGITLWHVGLIVVCMVAARTAAMGANRLLDADLDRQNPRTARRAVPAGRVRRGFVIAAIAAAGLMFVAAAAGFGWRFGNWLPLVLAVPVLAFLCGYPLIKRFSSLCHYYLGAALAIAPICAEVAVAGTVSGWAIWLAIGVLCWTAGFDIIYATVDRDSDVATGVHSVPAKLGLGRALWLSRATHVVSIAAFVMAGVAAEPLSWLYFLAVAAAAGLLALEQWLVRADDLSRVNLAFFTFNGLISLTVGGLGIIDLFW